MRSRLARSIVLVFIVALGSGSVTPSMVNELPKYSDCQRQVLRSLLVDDPQERHLAVTEALRVEFSDHSGSCYGESIAFLERISRWVDLKEFESLILEIDDVKQRPAGRRVLDMNQLSRSSRGNRENYYRRAIASGRTELPLGSVLDRFVAMHLAALDGMTELVPDIEKYHEAMQIELRSSLPLEYLNLTASYRSGASDRTGAVQNAATRLKAEMARDLWERFLVSETFRRVLDETVGESCQVNPLTGGITQECRTSYDVLQGMLLHGRLVVSRNGESANYSDSLLYVEASLQRIKRLMPEKASVTGVTK